jgi:hypothetical protein
MNSLLVGVGISDRAAPGEAPVTDAVTAEGLGYDFVSVFDHPVADAYMAEARGYAVVPSIVPRVLGVPFRRPALVAKAAESLQRPGLGRVRPALASAAHLRTTQGRIRTDPCPRP